MRPSLTPATRTPAMPPQPRRRRVSLPRDVYNGAVRGDFEHHLGLAGALTQALLGYVPGIGTICAMRDFVADLRQRDHLGAMLNVLALFPVLGGFPKTAEVLRHVHLVGRAVAKTRRRAYDEQQPY